MARSVPRRSRAPRSTTPTRRSRAASCPDGENAHRIARELRASGQGARRILRRAEGAQSILSWRTAYPTNMLPRLRGNLDFLPSPMPDRPGLVIRDPFQYSDATLIIPPSLVTCLEFFDGVRTELDLREYLVRLTGDISVGDLERHLIDTLSDAGFLDDDNF